MTSTTQRNPSEHLQRQRDRIRRRELERKLAQEKEAEASRKQAGHPPHLNQTSSKATAGSQPSKVKTRQFQAYIPPSKHPAGIHTSSGPPKGKKPSQKPKALEEDYKFPIQETENPASPSNSTTLFTVKTSIPEQESYQAGLPYTYAVSVPATPKDGGTQSSASLQDEFPNRRFTNAEDSGIGQSYSAI